MCMWQCASAGVAVCVFFGCVVVAVVAMHVRTHEYQKPIFAVIYKQSTTT